MLFLLMCNDLIWYMHFNITRSYYYIAALIGFSVFSFVVDIPGTHASDGVFVVERTGTQLFSWCRPYPHPATIAIFCSTLAHQIVVCTHN